MTAKKGSKKKPSTTAKKKPPRKPLSFEEWEKLILKDFYHCPICGQNFTVIIGCRKICSCGYLEGCED